MKRQYFFLLVFLSLASGGCKSLPPPSAPQPESVEPQAPFVHAPSGMRFPDAVGDFQRSQIFRYDAKGLDVSAGYNLASTAGFMVATVYIYPAPSLVSIGSPPDVVASARETLCRNEFEHRKREVFNAHPGARLIREEGIAPPHPGTSTAGRRAVFEYDASFAGGQQPIHSELWIFCYIGGKWALEYRFSSPLSVDAGPVISAFMATLPWPISP